MKSNHNDPPQTSGPLLHTKLMPPRPHPALIERAELMMRLNAGLTRKLTVVSAPTGFGKTSLVGMWMSKHGLPSAWVTLDENDNDPVRFWTYVVSAIRSLDSSLGKSALSALAAPQPPSFQNLLTPLINELTQLKGDAVLVLEDYHVITSREIRDGISFLLQHLPESLHLVLLTRGQPDLALPILRARDELVEVGVDDLRFTPQETESFLRMTASIQLPAAMITSLTEKTEGWIAGLRLLASSLQRKSDPAEWEKSIQAFSGNDPRVADYLIQEVFASQPESTRSFLLRTCFFPRLNGSLCEAITGDPQGAASLDGLERDNLFLTCMEHGSQQSWYRYNPLFAESIQHLARQRLGAEEIRSLFEKASAWYEYHGLFEEAIETALTAKLFERALGLIVKFIERHDLSEFRTLGRWLEILPAQEILRHPAICFAYAQVILYSADRFAPSTATRIEPFLHAAETTWRAQENQQGLGEVLAFRANVSLWQGDFQKAFDQARQSLEQLPESDVLYRGNSLLILSHESLNAGQISQALDHVLEARALLGAAQNIYGVLASLQVLAEVFYWQGEFEQAEQLNRQIMEEAIGEVSMLDDQGVASLNLARIAYERNDLEQADQWVARALDLAEQRNHEMLRVQSTVQMAYLHAARNDLLQAQEVLKELTTRIQNPGLLRVIQETQARLALLAGDSSALTSWRAVVSHSDPNALPAQREWEDFTLARLHLAEGEPGRALSLIERWKRNAAENGRVRSQIGSACLAALAHHAASNPAQATQSAVEALTLGRAKGFCRLFLDEGARMAGLLQAILPLLPNRTLNLYASTLLHSFPPETLSRLSASHSNVVVEPLSQQEIRVLRLLVAGRSNPDIAQELVVSVNTIKSQVKSIYRKLGVTSREEVREVARALKLL